jgi:hypothetical protein
MDMPARQASAAGPFDVTRRLFDAFEALHMRHRPPFSC